MNHPAHISGHSPEPFTYEFTRDHALLYQFRLLCGTQDEFDDASQFLIARRGRLVLGGCRLTVHVPGEGADLPMESGGFQLAQTLKDFDLAHNTYAEISRVVIAASVEDSLQREIMLELVAGMVERMMELNVRYMFCKSTRAYARSWRMVAYSIGLNSHRIYTEISVPSDPVAPGVDCVLTYLELPALPAERFAVQSLDRTAHQA